MDFLILAAALVFSASGDLIYSKTVQARPSAIEAGAIASAFIAAEAWDGQASEMIQCMIKREPRSPTGFYARCDGEVAVDPADFPIGKELIGRVP